MKGGGWIAVVVVILIIAMLGSCSNSSSSSSSKYDGYSDTYKYDSDYRSNVKDIADEFGVSEREVDRKINAVSGGK